MHFFLIFLQKYLVMSKKSSTFARFFVGRGKTNGFCCQFMHNEVAHDLASIAQLVEH